MTQVPFGLAPAREGDRVTTLELFFDLVFVFAFTQVSGLMAHGAAPWSVVDGFIVFALLWWSWCSYAWVANMVHANAGLMRVIFAVVTAAMLVASLAIPEALHDLPGGLDGPLVLVVCYALVRLLHNGVYLVVAGEDRTLRRQVLLSLTLWAVPASLLLATGALLHEPWQRPVWLVDVVYDLVVIFVTSRRGGGWVVASAAHFAERHALVVILALGESIVAIAAGIAQEPISGPIIVGAVLAVSLSAGLWLHYFRRLAPHLEHGLASPTGASRAHAARDVFTYLHLPIVGGIILASLGIEQALAHLRDGNLGTVGAVALTTGIATSIVAMQIASRRLGGRWCPWRLGVAALLLALAFVLPGAPSLVALGIVAVVVIVAGAVTIYNGRTTVGCSATPSGARRWPQGSVLG